MNKIFIPILVIFLGTNVLTAQNQYDRRGDDIYENQNNPYSDPNYYPQSNQNNGNYNQNNGNYNRPYYSRPAVVINTAPLYRPLSFCTPVVINPYPPVYNPYYRPHYGRRYVNNYYRHNGYRGHRGHR